ncbi:3'(2'),5'-bisphosphate nucleotidase CysQ [Alphaproteobacteria bacterium LSUCC0684]
MVAPFMKDVPMHLSPSQITHLETIAIDAGNAIMQIRKRGVERDHKADGSPVTAADLAADEIITSGLLEIAPSLPAITEETYTGEDDHEPGEYWCVDPLDGTKGYINGGKDFTVNIALIRDRHPVLGVIYAPATGTLWAGAECKAWKRQADISGQDDLLTKASLDDLGAAFPISSRKVRREDPDVVATRAHRGPALEAWIARIGAQSSVAVGSSLKFCVIAEGEADLYPRIGPTMEWDTAAGQAIVEASGGLVIGPDGTPFGYGKPGRLNGYFAAMGQVDGSVPSEWIPPHEGGDG